jgi:hypothetical protein
METQSLGKKNCAGKRGGGEVEICGQKLKKKEKHDAERRATFG